MNILDILVIILLLIGAFHGWKYGGFSSIVSLLGTVLVFVLSFYLKNPISTILYENLPFHTFGGIFSGITSFNILVYEGIAYVICLIVLSILLKIILKLSGLIDKVINLTIVLTIPNKIVGLVCKTLEYYVFIFVGLFVLAQLPIGAPYFKDSTVSKSILKDTPLLSDVTNDIYSSVNEIYDICLKYDKETDKKQADYESLDVLMKYDIITPDSVSKLAERHKLRIDNVDVLIEKYKGEKMIKYLKENNFLDMVKEGTVLVDFYADWCGPCKMMGTILEEMDEINVLKVNTDEFNELALQHGIMSIPTLILYKDGSEVGKLIGLHSKDDILEFINNN